MSTRVCKCNGNEDDRLPMFHRTIRITAELWKEVKAHGEMERKAIRWVIDDPLDAELMSMIASLRAMGFKGEDKPDKLVRAPLDDNVIGRLNHSRRQTGLPAVLLLRVCLDRYVASDDGR